MRKYSVDHSLELHGEITQVATGASIFNYYLAQGYSYYFGDDFDLWITSDPFREGQMSLNGIVKHKPVTAEELKLARNLVDQIKGLSTCGVTGGE